MFVMPQPQTHRLQPCAGFPPPDQQFYERTILETSTSNEKLIIGFKLTIPQFEAFDREVRRLISRDDLLQGDFGTISLWCGRGHQTFKSLVTTFEWISDNDVPRVWATNMIRSFIVRRVREAKQDPKLLDLEKAVFYRYTKPEKPDAPTPPSKKGKNKTLALRHFIVIVTIPKLLVKSLTGSPKDEDEEGDRKVQFNIGTLLENEGMGEKNSIIDLEMARLWNLLEHSLPGIKYSHYVLEAFDIDGEIVSDRDLQRLVQKCQENKITTINLVMTTSYSDDEEEEDEDFIGVNADSSDSGSEK